MANKTLKSICGSLNMLKLTQMFILMIRITVVDNTGDFQKYVFLLRGSVVSLEPKYIGYSQVFDKRHINASRNTMLAIFLQNNTTVFAKEIGIPHISKATGLFN